MEYEYAFKKNVVGRTVVACGIVLKVFLIILWNVYARMSVMLRILSLLAITIYPMAFLKVALSNPGRLKRNEKCPCGGSMRLSDGMVVKTYPEQYMRDIIVPSPEKSTIFRQEMCSTCLIYKSNQTSHCSDCNSCLLEKDHHCFWVANCIGRNNYKQFLILILWGAIIFLLSGLAFQDLLSGYVMCSFISFNLFAFSFILFSFFTYYIILCMFGLTSREYLNGKRASFIGLPKLCKNAMRNKPPIIIGSVTV